MILHVDLDAFFASVEVLDDPALAGRPLVVGASAAERGVVAAASYEARRFGIHSAMPMARAERLCPGLVRRPARHERYAELSARAFAIFGAFTPLVEGLSIDEAFLDVAGSERLFGDAVAIARQIRRRVRAELGLTCSIGVAANKFVAKVASDRSKPDGLLVVAPGREAEFLAPLPLRCLWGVGPKTAAPLERLGLKTVGDVARCPAPALAGALGGEGAAHLARLARGLDDRPVVVEREAKSVSREETFAVFLTAREALERKLFALAEDVARRLRREGLRGRTVHLKLRDGKFRTLTRSVTLPAPANRGPEIYAAARRLLAERVDLGGRAVRLIGVGVSGFAAGPRQADLLADAPAERAREERADRLERAADRLRERLGPKAIRRAPLV